MLKMLVCLITGMFVAVMLLHFRQERLQLSYQSNQLHSKIESHQARLWNQQLQIAVYTAPNAISKTVGDQALKLTPLATVGVVPTNWMEPIADPSVSAEATTPSDSPTAPAVSAAAESSN